jgi:hypothetical protein
MEKESIFIRRMNSTGSLLAPDDFSKYSNGEMINLLRVLVKHLIQASNEFDFKCDFDKKGECTGTRKGDRPKDDFHAKMCCCSNCYAALGYLQGALPITKQDLPTYEKLFKRKIGFWRRGKGCSLPRELRSTVCVFYSCKEEVERRIPLDSMRWNCSNAITQIRRLTFEDLKRIEIAREKRRNKNVKREFVVQEH